MTITKKELESARRKLQLKRRQLEEVIPYTEPSEEEVQRETEKRARQAEDFPG